MKEKPDSYSLAALLRKTCRRYPLSAGSQALFYELVAIANEDGWPHTFKCSNGALCSVLMVSEKTLAVLRNELIQSGLILYKSGKSKKIIGEYSIWTQAYILMKTTVKFTTEANTKANTKANTNTTTKATTIPSDLIKVKDNSKLNNEEEINAGEQSFIPKNDDSGKEKSSAQKEKELPDIDEILKLVQGTANWRNVIELYPEFKITETMREDLFTIFWKEKEDDHRKRLPEFMDLAKHFYNWIPYHMNKKQSNGKKQQQQRSTPANGGTDQRGLQAGLNWAGVSRRRTKGE